MDFSTQKCLSRITILIIYLIGNLVFAFTNNHHSYNRVPYRIRDSRSFHHLWRIYCFSGNTCRVSFPALQNFRSTPELNENDESASPPPLNGLIHITSGSRHSQRTDTNFPKFKYVSKTQSSQDRDHFLQKLRKFSAKSINLSSREKKDLLHEIVNWLPVLSASDIVKVMGTLILLKIPSKSKESIEINELILEKLDSMTNVISSKDMSLALSGLVKLGINCLDKRHKTSLKRASLPNAPVFKSTTVVGKRYSMSSHSSSADSRTLFDGLPRTMAAMDALQLSTSLWAMGKLGFLWDDLSVDLQKVINLAVIRLQKSMTPICVANTIHGNSK